MEVLRFDMVSESLARKFRPAGFDQPEGSRHEYTKPSPELQEAFDEWMGELLTEYVPDFNVQGEYKRACQMIKTFEKIPYREANSLLSGLYPKNYGESCAGLFISACYNQSPEQVIVFDLESKETKFIGYRLGRKVLVNNGKVGFAFGSHSHGVVVNNQIAGENFGYKSDGVLLNNGETWDGFGIESSGIVISDNRAGWWLGLNSSGYSIIIKEPISVGRSKAKRVLRPNDIEKIPELEEYLEEFCDLTKSIKDEESAKRFLEKYGPTPRKMIEQDIKKFLSSRE